VVKPRLLQRERRAAKLRRKRAHALDQPPPLAPVAGLLPFQQAGKPDLTGIQSQPLRHGDTGSGCGSGSGAVTAGRSGIDAAGAVE
jgi:hypothetical protein